MEICMNKTNLYYFGNPLWGKIAKIVWIKNQSQRLARGQCRWIGPAAYDAFMLPKMHSKPEYEMLQDGKVKAEKEIRCWEMDRPRSTQPLPGEKCRMLVMFCQSSKEGQQQPGVTMLVIWKTTARILTKCVWGLRILEVPGTVLSFWHAPVYVILTRALWGSD